MNLSIELINAILGYLGSKPYAEVAQLINAIQAEAKQPKEQENAVPQRDS